MEEDEMGRVCYVRLRKRAVTLFDISKVDINYRSFDN